MRLFIALDVPEAVREEARRRVAAVQGRLPAARWVDLEKVHLTLVFLGATDEALVPALSAALARAAASVPAFSLALAGGGTFPPRRPARVAWIGLAAPPELARLQAAAQDAAAAAVRTFQAEDRPYSPHVTVARCPDPWPRAAAETFAAALAGQVGEPFTVRDVVLYESQLGRGGARYRAVERLPLGGAA